MIQIFRADGRTNGRTDEGVPRSPRGPKKVDVQPDICCKGERG